MTKLTNVIRKPYRHDKPKSFYAGQWPIHEFTWPYSNATGLPLGEVYTLREQFFIRTLGQLQALASIENLNRRKYLAE